MKTAIIGVGNKLMGDEGVGIHAIEHLRKKEINIIGLDLNASKSTKADIIKTHPPLGVRPFFDILDGGTGGMTLLHTFERYEHVVLIDVADFGGEPGEIKVFVIASDSEAISLKQLGSGDCHARQELWRARNNITLTPDSAQVSLHGASIAGILELAKKLGTKLPQIIIIAVQPKSICPSFQLSEECAKALPIIEEELGKIFHGSTSMS